MRDVKKYVFGPPSKISLTSWIIIRGGPKVYFFFKLVHLAMFLNQIFMLNPKIITIFPYIHFLVGYFMFLILVIFSDSYKKINEKLKSRPLETTCGSINNCYAYILVKSCFSTYFPLLLHHQREKNMHRPQEIKYETFV